MHQANDQWTAARALLGVEEDASDEQLRKAYVEQVRRYPPDRDPDRFEKIRDAYALLKDPVRRADRVLAVLDHEMSLTALLGDARPTRRHVATELWLGILKETRS